VSCSWSAGRLGDKFGQRRLFLIGLGGFTLASAAAGFSPDPALLIVARVGQGAFGALLIPQGVAIMTITFDKDMLGKAFELFAPVLGLSSVGGPVLAGFIISADLFGLSWRPIFLINIILGIIGLIMAGKILPRDEDGDRSAVVDGWASGLLAVSMLGLLYGLIEGSTNGWGVIPIVSIVVGVLFFAACGYRQRTATHPLITPSLMTNRGFTSGLLVCLVAVAAGSGLLFVLSLFLQVGLHVSPRDTSLGLVPLTVGLAAAGFASMGGLVAKLGRRLVVIGLAVDLVAAVGYWSWSLTLGRTSASGRWPRRCSSSASALASASPQSPSSLSATRNPTKPAAPAARSARSSSSLQRSARLVSRRSSSKPQPPDWPMRWKSLLSSFWPPPPSASRSSP
jgi:MFS family permease